MNLYLIDYTCPIFMFKQHISNNVTKNDILIKFIKQTITTTNIIVVMYFGGENKYMTEA